MAYTNWKGAHSAIRTNTRKENKQNTNLQRKQNLKCSNHRQLQWHMHKYNFINNADSIDSITFAFVKRESEKRILEYGILTFQYREQLVQIQTFRGKNVLKYFVDIMFILPYFMNMHTSKQSHTNLFVWSSLAQLPCCCYSKLRKYQKYDVNSNKMLSINYLWAINCGRAPCPRAFR